MEALVVSLISAILFVIFSFLFASEEKRGGRYFLSGARDWLDNKYTKIFNLFERGFRYVARYIITLSWYYSLHTFLKLILKSLAGLYTMIENILIQNRNRAREIRKERRQSHLTAIAEHQVTTSLTDKEKKKIKDNALRG